MGAAMAHRGPDQDGLWREDGVALSHRRLSIIDVSEASRQPMISACERYVMVFNGEIYNFGSLRTELEAAGRSFRTTGDSEVVLEAIAAWGAAAFERLNGMFALAVWDRRERTLLLGRDRMGIKPLYWAQDAGGLLFASEIRALLAGGVPRRLNHDALGQYLAYGTVFEPMTLVRGVQMLPAATWLRVSEGGERETHRFWRLGDPGDPPSSEQEVLAATRDHFVRAVQRRTISDVPLGAFLSGGVDSSLVVAAMANASSGPVHTFSVEIGGSELDESRWSRRVAERWGTKHQRVVMSADDFRGAIPDALESFDHPSGDGPNTWIVSQACRQAGMVVALSGLGADELFAGYPAFRRAQRFGRHALAWRLTSPLRKAGSTAVRALGPTIRDDYRWGRLADLLSESGRDPGALYPHLRRMLDDAGIEALGVAGTPPAGALSRVATAMSGDGADPGVLSTISRHELAGYLRHILLRDTDQMSMAHSLEVRVPFLDHELVEHVYNLSDDAKRPAPAERDGEVPLAKGLLYRALGDWIDREIAFRPKMGFDFPWADWMRGELHGFCEERIESLARRDVFRGERIRERWSLFVEGSRTVHYMECWLHVVLESWLQTLEIDS